MPTIEVERKLQWTDEKNKVIERQSFDLMAKKDREQFEALHPDRKTEQTKDTIEKDLSGIAFNLSLSREELNSLMEQDPEQFRKIYQIAIANGIDWAEAERLASFEKQSGDYTLHKIGNSYDNRYGKDVKPRKLLENPHKPRPKRTKKSLVKSAYGFLRWKGASDAINSENPTPLDDHPEFAHEDGWE
jgi:hypothetical protein